MRKFIIAIIVMATVALVSCTKYTAKPNGTGASTSYPDISCHGCIVTVPGQEAY
jgi:hypothetical protein